MTVGIVVVSHSKELAEAAVDLATQMVAGERPAIAMAAGTDDGRFGTDAMLIMNGISEVDSGDGVVVLTDLGSAILSTEMALEFLGEPDDVVVVGAPFVEGLISAVVSASAGSSLADVATEARGSLAAKVAQIGDDAGGAAEQSEGESEVSGGQESGGPNDDVPSEPEASAAVRVVNQFGLHARPAARVVHEASQFDARVEIVADGQTQSASSPLALAAMGTTGGDELEVRATGPQAQEAVDAVVKLIASGFGEELISVEAEQPTESGDDGAAADERRPVLPTARSGALSAATPPPLDIVVGVSSGRVVGEALRMPEPVKEPAGAAVEDVAAEKDKLPKAVATVDQDLAEREERAEGTAAEILAATRALLKDPTIVDEANTVIERGSNAPRAVWEALGKFAAQFEEAGDLTAERAADIYDIRARLVSVLSGSAMPGVPVRDEPFILVAHELAPADAATLDASTCLGLLLSQGGPMSHTAIVARSLGIPALIAPVIADLAVDGDRLLIDGDTNEAVINPSEEQYAGARTEPQCVGDADPLDGPTFTSDRARVEIMANVGNVSDARRAMERGAEGVGLFRTEFLFFGRAVPPSFDEQVSVYSEALDVLGGRPCVFRTLDAGADKPLPFVSPEKEENPALGVRGYRTSVRFPQVLRTQLEAIAQAAQGISGEVSAMAPMIATAAEARDFAELARSCGLKNVGVMIETPSAALQAHRILEAVDFVSVGTNDLTQYTMAADRESTTLAALTTGWQPAVLQLISEVGVAGSELSKPVGVCGEAASDPLLAGVLIGLGVNSLSMNPTFVPVVGRAVEGYSLEACRAAAQSALTTDSPEGARAAASELLHQAQR